MIGTPVTWTDAWLGVDDITYYPLYSMLSVCYSDPSRHGWMMQGCMFGQGCISPGGHMELALCHSEHKAHVRGQPQLYAFTTACSSLASNGVYTRLCGLALLVNS